nr:mRNA-capping enzyme-like isoform X5 [Tanacetum cinerariifolium]
MISIRVYKRERERERERERSVLEREDILRGSHYHHRYQRNITLQVLHLAHKNHITRCSSDRAWSDAEEGDGAENSSFDVVKEAHVINRPSKMLSQSAKPPFFNKRTVFIKQAEPIFPKDPTSDMAKISRKSSKLVHEKQSMDKSYDRNSLPAGWLDCPPYGDALGFIIPSKVPLKESFNDKIIIDKRYSPQQAILQQRRLGRELGLVIDLTVRSQIGYDKRSPDRDDDVASGLQDNGFQENQVTNVVGKVPLNRMESMRQFCNKVLKPKSQGLFPGSHPVSLLSYLGLFPGSHPVSLSRENLRLLRQRYYYTKWKADGTRYMMLITWDGCYLIEFIPRLSHASDGLIFQPPPPS